MGSVCRVNDALAKRFGVWQLARAVGGLVLGPGHRRRFLEKSSLVVLMGTSLVWRCRGQCEGRCGLGRAGGHSERDVRIVLPSSASSQRCKVGARKLQ